MPHAAPLPPGPLVALRQQDQIRPGAASRQEPICEAGGAGAKYTNSLASTCGAGCGARTTHHAQHHAAPRTRYCRYCRYCVK
jgi:hypothetical protein